MVLLTIHNIIQRVKGGEYSLAVIVCSLNEGVGGYKRGQAEPSLRLWVTAGLQSHRDGIL